MDKVWKNGREKKISSKKILFFLFFIKKNKNSNIKGERKRLQFAKCKMEKEKTRRRRRRRGRKEKEIPAQAYCTDYLYGSRQGKGSVGEKGRT